MAMKIIAVAVFLLSGVCHAQEPYHPSMASMIGYEAQMADMCGISSAPLEAAARRWVERALDANARWNFITQISEGRMIRAYSKETLDCSNARKMVDHYENLFRTARTPAELAERYRTGR